MTKSKTKSSYLAAICGIFTLLLLPTPQINAQAPQTNVGGITASPAELQLEVASSQPSQAKQVTVSNNYDVPLTFTAELKSIDEDSGLLLPAGDLSAALKNSLKVSETEFSVQPRSNRVITVTANNSNELTPGGHYAALVLTQRSETGLRSAISINLFFIKADGAIKKIQLDTLEAQNWLFHIASLAKVSFSNDGNVHSTPHGLIYVTDRHNNLISKGLVNTGSQPLWPNKSLTNDVNLTRIQRVWYPQKLFFNISYRADDYDSTTKTYSFWYIPPIYVAIPAVLILGLLFVWLKRRKRTQKTTNKPASPRDDMPRILKVAIRFTNEEETSKIKVKRKGHLDLRNKN